MLFFTDSGPLPLLMMSKAYITAEVDKLIQHDQYTKVLQMDPPDGAEGGSEPPRKMTRQEAKKGHHSLPSLEELRYLEEAAADKIEGKAPPQFEEFRGKGQVSADIFNLSDMRQVMRLQRYLQDNGSYELFHTPKNGQCTFSSIRRGIQLPEEFRSNHLRFQLIHFIVENHEFCYGILEKVIKYEYGHHRISKEQYLAGMKAGTLTEGEIVDYQIPGPFSFVAYLKYIMEDSTWGDFGLLTLLGMMWQLTITVVNAEDLSQVKIRHRRPLENADLVLVLAQRCHYLGTCEFMFFISFLILLLFRAF